MIQRERMGSGGLRGPQILRSGATRVRGGFNSHAFPPIVALAAVLWLRLPPGARAETRSSGTTPADSGRAAVKTTATIPAGTTPAAESEEPPATGRTIPMAERSRFDQPRWVMMRSLVVPGWGQAYNKAWFKAAGVAAGELALIKAIVNDEHELSHLSDQIDQAQADGDEAAYDKDVADYNARSEDH